MITYESESGAMVERVRAGRTDEWIVSDCRDWLSGRGEAWGVVNWEDDTTTRVQASADE